EGGICINEILLIKDLFTILNNFRSRVSADAILHFRESPFKMRSHLVTGNRYFKRNPISGIFHGYPCNAVCLCMEMVVTGFMQYIQCYKHAAGNSDGKAKYIDARHYLVSCKIPESKFEIVLEHKQLYKCYSSFIQNGGSSQDYQALPS